MKKSIKQKGFIQIPLLAGIIIATVIASGIGARIVLNRQDKAGIYEEPQGLIIKEESIIEEGSTEVENDLENISEDSEQEKTKIVPSSKTTKTDTGSSKNTTSSYLEKEEIERIKKEARRIEEEIEKIKILAEEIKQSEEEKNSEEDKIVDEEESKVITREKLFNILKQEINERFQKRINDVQIIQNILNEYSKKINDAKKLKDEEIASANFCHPCSLPVILWEDIEGIYSRCCYDANKCNNLRQLHETIIENLENERKLEIERNWPFWSSSQPGLDVPDIELFSIKDEIKTTDNVYSIEALSKLDGGYLIKFVDLDIEFEVIALADGSYYLKK